MTDTRLRHGAIEPNEKYNLSRKETGIYPVAVCTRNYYWLCTFWFIIIFILFFLNCFARRRTNNANKLGF